MPCYTTFGITLDVARYDLDVLERALKALGYRVERDAEVLAFGWGNSYADGQLSLRVARQADADQLQKLIAQAYTREAIATAARRQGLRVQDAAVLRLRAGGR